MHKNRFPTIILTLSLFAFTLTACGNDRESPAAPAAVTALPAPAQTDAAAQAPAQEAPAASTATESPLVAAGASSLATPVADSPMPTPTVEVSGVTGETSAETGAITGKILITRDGADVPVASMIVGLAEVIRDENGDPRATGYSPDNAPKGTTDDEGGFAVNEVPPGMYSLILDAVITSYQLEDPGTGETILVEIEPDQVVDIGVLRYSSLPVPGFAKQQ